MGRFSLVGGSSSGCLDADAPTPRVRGYDAVRKWRMATTGIFFPKKLSPKQAEWPAYYRELLAVYTAVQLFRHLLIQSSFAINHCTIYTDHKPITFAFKQQRDKLPLVQLNQLSFIRQFTTDIQHVSGADNVVADAFSRIAAINISPVALNFLANAQADDSELQITNASSLHFEFVQYQLPYVGAIYYPVLWRHDKMHY